MVCQEGKIYGIWLHLHHQRNHILNPECLNIGIHQSVWRRALILHGLHGLHGPVACMACMGLWLGRPPVITDTVLTVPIL